MHSNRAGSNTNNRYVSTDEETKIFLRLTGGGKKQSKISLTWGMLTRWQLVLFPACNLYFFYVLLRLCYPTVYPLQPLDGKVFASHREGNQLTVLSFYRDLWGNALFNIFSHISQVTSYDSLQLAVVSVTVKESGDALVWVESKEITISWFAVTGVLLRNNAENAPSQPSSAQLRWKRRHLNKAVIVFKSTKPRFHLLWYLFPAVMHQGSGYSDLTRDSEFKLDFTLWWLHYTINPSNGGSTTGTSFY